MNSQSKPAAYLFFKAKMPYITKVECYCGYKANQRPISFTINDKKLTVEKIIERWREPGIDYFKLLANDRKIYLLSYNEVNDKWKVEKVYE